MRLALIITSIVLFILASVNVQIGPLHFLPLGLAFFALASII